MRKLKLQVQLSVDGRNAGPNGEMDWLTWNWDDELKDFVNALHDNVDTILLGRKMADGFITHWEKAAGNPDDPSQAFAKIMAGAHKVVFTKTLAESTWPNTSLAKGDLAEEVNRLKQQPGGDIIVYGGADFLSSLVQASLIDELNLFINPVMAGKGLGIYGKLDHVQQLKLKQAWPFACGIVVLTYEPAKS